MDNKLKILLQSALALIGIFLLSKMSDPKAYYSNGGRAQYVHFLLEEARSDLFREVTALECNTFDALIKEFKQRDMLKNG
jgi:phage protein U